MVNFYESSNVPATAKLILTALEDIFSIMDKSIFLGFDGGATKTTGIAMDPGRNVFAEETGGPANFQIIGTEKASESIFSVTEALLKKAGTSSRHVKVMYLGLTGAGRIADADRMRDAFIEFLRNKGFPVPDVRIGSDAIAALEGAFAGRPGMILISGTGSILFAKDEDEKIHRVGGWGRYIGDEGSGYALGRACLSAIAKEFDGRGRKTSMSRLLKEARGIDTSQALISEIYRNKLEIASLAPLVIQAAGDGDEIAAHIVAHAANELSDHVRGILPKLKTTVPIVLAGSILSTDNSLSRKVRQLIQENFPNLTIQDAEHSPAFGAALLAIKTESPK